MPPFDSLKQVVTQLMAITPDELQTKLSQTVTKYEGEIKNISQDKDLEPSAKAAEYKKLRDRINETKTRYTAYLQSLKVEENKPTVQNFLGELDRLTKSLDAQISVLEQNLQAAQASALQASSAEVVRKLQSPSAPTPPPAPPEDQEMDQKMENPLSESQLKRALDQLSGNERVAGVFIWSPENYTYTSRKEFKESVPKIKQAMGLLNEEERKTYEKFSGAYLPISDRNVRQLSVYYGNLSFINIDCTKTVEEIAEALKADAAKLRSRQRIKDGLIELSKQEGIRWITMKWYNAEYNLKEVEESIPKIKAALDLLTAREKAVYKETPIIISDSGRSGRPNAGVYQAAMFIDYKKSAQEIADKLKEASKRGEVELALSDLAKKYGLLNMFLWGNQEYDVAEVSQSMSELEKALGMLGEQERRNIKYRIVVTHDGEEGPLNTAGGKSQVFGIDYKKSAQEIADKLKEAPLTPLMQEFEKLNYDFKGMIGSESESRKKFAEEIMFICKIRHVSASDIKWEEIFPAESNIDYSGGSGIITAPVARANTNLETLAKVEEWIRENLGKRKNPRKTKGSKSGVTETAHKLPLELATLKASFDATANFHPGLEWTPELQAKLETIKTTIRALESAGHEPTVLKMGNKIYIVSGATETPAGTKDRTYAESAAAAARLGVSLMSEAQYKAINPSIKQLDVAGWTWLQTDDLSNGRALYGVLNVDGTVRVLRHSADLHYGDRGWRASLRVSP